MQVTVQVAPEVARGLRGGRSSGALFPQIEGMLEHFSITLEPLHRDLDDDTLTSYFVVEVPDYQTAQAVIRGLRSCQGIRAAYLKPAAELP